MHQQSNANKQHWYM